MEIPSSLRFRQIVYSNYNTESPKKEEEKGKIKIAHEKLQVEKMNAALSHYLF
jgi:hypothetical protein